MAASICTCTFFCWCIAVHFSIEYFTGVHSWRDRGRMRVFVFVFAFVGVLQCILVFHCSAFVERQGEEASHSAGKSSQRPVAKQRTALHCTSVFVFVVPR